MQSIEYFFTRLPPIFKETMESSESCVAILPTEQSSFDVPSLRISSPRSHRPPFGQSPTLKSTSLLDEDGRIFCRRRRPPPPTQPSETPPSSTALVTRFRAREKSDETPPHGTSQSPAPFPVKRDSDPFEHKPLHFLACLLLAGFDPISSQLPSSLPFPIRRRPKPSSYLKFSTAPPHFLPHIHLSFSLAITINWP